MRYSFVAQHGHKRAIGLAFAAAMVVLLAGSYAFADVGPSCGRSYDHHPRCVENPYHLTATECFNFCEKSEYCKPYEDDTKSNFSGFWNIPWVSHYELSACEEECKAEKAQCAIGDEECLARFEPENIDCSTLSDDAKDWCDSYCVNSILTSECGRSCLKNGIDEEHSVLNSVNGCQQNNYCSSNLCNESYCAAIPVKYETRWSIFGVLMALLAAFTGIILVVMHKNDRAEDKRS